MFKLLKELTKPPEPLAPPSSHGDPAQAHFAYAARHRARSASPSPSPVNGRSRSNTLERAPPGARRASDLRHSEGLEKEEEEAIVETDEDAKRVVELLKALKEARNEEGGSGFMLFVETFSQLNSIPGHARSRRAFRRHGGFGTLRSVLSDGLAYKPSQAGMSEEESQVEEVQRLEGVRLAFETLSWAIADRESLAYFEVHLGYSSLLPALYSLAPLSTPTPSDQPSSSSFPPAESDPAPRRANSHILALLAAHILSNNYSTLSIFSSDGASGNGDLGAKLGEPVLRHASALGLLWSYVWGWPDQPGAGSPKGKEKAPLTQLLHRTNAGDFEGGKGSEETEQARLVVLTFKILLATAQASTANLFLIAKHLPQLTDFLLTRLYGFPEERKYEVTFPARGDWAPKEEGEDEVEEVDVKWEPPSPELRAVYLPLLRRVLEAGVDQNLSWRLFSLVREENRPPAPLETITESPASSGATSPQPGGTNGQVSESDNASSSPQLLTRKKGPRLPKLRMPSVNSTQGMETEKLRGEVMDLVRHSMKARWPDVFVFRSPGGGEEGGIELRDLGRPWPSAQKGFNFSCWVHITKLNQPITVLHVSQSGSKYPLVQIRILENSQIGLLTSVPPPAHSDASQSHELPSPPEELICSAPDALVPHHQWVHFAVGCRRLKSAEAAEVRIFVNGVRVGAMRTTYPVPKPPSHPPAQPQLHAKPAIPADALRVGIGREVQCDLLEDAKSEEQSGGLGQGQAEGNEWMLGRTLLLDEAVQEDMVLLLHHLGPRYAGNFQEALGKFLTYEGATSINIYLHALAQSAPDKRLFTQPTKSLIVRAIRTGPALAEETILLSLSARNVYRDADGMDNCTNAAIPHPSRAKQLRHGHAKLVGANESFVRTCLDDSVGTVGGGTVVLKMIDLARTSEELAATLGILKDMIRDSWSASEEMERIHGFDLLAAILRPKMPQLVDVACAKIILSMLGIHVDKPGAATVHNSVAYRSLALDFELWSYAQLPVVAVYLQHFEHLLSTSKHMRYNVLRTFQKSAMVRKMLYALRSGFFEPTAVPMAVDTLRLALIARWSGEDAIKPTFSYLVSALCQNNAFGVTSMTDPPPSQAPAALILDMIADVASDHHRLIKLNRSIALHRLLVIFISSNSAYYVILPCLKLLEQCLTTPGLESFQRSFEGEGGFALLARTLGPIWREDIQAAVFRMCIGPDEAKAALACPNLVAALMAAVEAMLQSAGDSDDSGTRPTTPRTRSATITSIRSINMLPAISIPTSGPEQDTRLEDLLKELTAVYRTSSPFRRSISNKRVEAMLPAFADFAAVSASSNKPDVARAQRQAAIGWLAALIEKSKLPHSLVNQASDPLMKLIVEQLRAPSQSPRPPSTPFSPMSPSSPRPSTSYFGTSFSSRFGTSPSTPRFGSSPSTPTAPIPRRRPSMEAGTPLALARSRSIVEKRIPLKRVLTGESILEGGKDKNAAWRLIIMHTDSQSHSKMTLERKDYWHRLSQEDWPRQAATLRTENGIWPDNDQPVTWRLDGSEGPLRMRNRLERVSAVPEAVMARTRHKLRDAIPSVDELSSAVSRVNSAPWEDPFALALSETASIAEEGAEPAPTLAQTPAARPGSPVQDERLDDESFVEVEENKDDKMRRIAKTLQAGDVVEEAHNIVRIVGVDACPGLLILGKKNLYLVDGLVQAADGEVIDAKDAPKDVLSIPSGTLVELDSADQQSVRWSYDEIVENNKRAFLFRDVALELYFSDKRNFLIVFKDKKERQAVVQRLQYKNDARDTISRSVIGNFVLDQVSRAMDKAEQQLEAMTRRWQNREISNFAYLQLLNQHANRTPNDVTQYPVFPWVVADYVSDVLDLTKESTFRDLSLPMGALTPARREAAVERYLATEGVGEKPFHYGTHYSSSMIVCGFMIRLSPFTEIFLALQGGNFDLADRLFSSIPRAWDSASADNRGDVRELIPEFYYSAAFLLNINRHDFGRKQVSGDTIDNVALPPWAYGDPMLFVHRHREALESDYVTRHLPAWIDLTFGYKQRDPASFNCFHPLSYRGAVDLENMSDEGEKAASTSIIHNFGQTPAQIFRGPHPHRFLSGRSELPLNTRFGVAEQWQLLLRSILPITETTTPIDDITEPSSDEFKPLPQQRFRIIVPGHSMLSVQYGFADCSLRVYYQEASPRLIHLIEGISVVQAIFAAPTLLVTVSNAGVLTVWRMGIKSHGVRRGDISMQREATLRGHTAPVTCVAASKSWSFVVSGAEDGSAMIWDMNRMRYIRTLQTPRKEPIKYCAVNEADGQIALASAHHIYLFSLNGHPIASASVETDDFLTFSFGAGAELPPKEEFTGGITFLNREFLRFGVLFVIGINSELALFRCVPGSKATIEFDDEEVQPWTLAEQGRLFRSDDHSGGGCTMVKFVGETLYAAFEPVNPGGKHLLYQWSLPESNARHVADSVSHTCMADKCGRHFGLLEPKRHCGGCGGVFCGTHAVHVESFNHRYCDECRSQLSYASATGILSNRRDSARPTSRPASRRGSVSASRPGSRRPSVSFALGGVGQGSGLGTGTGTGVGIGQGLQAPHLTAGATGGGTPQLHGNTKLGSAFSTPVLGP